MRGLEVEKYLEYRDDITAKQREEVIIYLRDKIQSVARFILDDGYFDIPLSNGLIIRLTREDLEKARDVKPSMWQRFKTWCFSPRETMTSPVPNTDANGKLLVCPLCKGTIDEEFARCFHCTNCGYMQCCDHDGHYDRHRAQPTKSA
jgi:hypothetical protein